MISGTDGQNLIKKKTMQLKKNPLLYVVKGCVMQNFAKITQPFTT